MKYTKKFHWAEDKPPIIYRPGTSDESIIQTVLVEKKEYLFPKFDPKIVYDIGGNIGVVAVILANIYPEATIYSFEPVSENFELLIMNSKEYKNIKPLKLGLGMKTGDVTIFKSDDQNNLGGYSTHISGEEGETVSIVRMETICAKLGTPDLIKIDCEGAEYEILNDIPLLENVKWITGELHGINDYKLLDLLDRHFKIQSQRGFGDKVWHFNALSKAWTDFGRDLTLQR